MLEKNTTNPNIMCKAISVVRQMSAYEKLLRDIQKREQTIINKRSALNGTKQQGKNERDIEFMTKWRKKAF